MPKISDNDTDSDSEGETEENKALSSTETLEIEEGILDLSDDDK